MTDKIMKQKVKITRSDLLQALHTDTISYWQDHPKGSGCYEIFPDSLVVEADIPDEPINLCEDYGPHIFRCDVNGRLIYICKKCREQATAGDPVPDVEEKK